jgi:glycerate-2-kinase
MEKIHQDAQTIIKESIQENMPQAAVKKALLDHTFGKSIYLIAIGKASWSMASAAFEELESAIKGC